MDKEEITTQELQAIVLSANDDTRNKIALFITCLEDVLQTSEGKQIALIMYRSMKQGITADYLKRLAKLFKEYEVIIVSEENS